MRIKLWGQKIIGLIKIYKNKNISKKSFIANGVQIFGIKNIKIEDNCTIGQHSIFTINERNEDIISLKIGRNTYIGRNNFFSVGKSINIGAYCIFGNNCSIISSNHIFSTPLVPYASSGFTTLNKIEIGTNCWFGINVTVIGNVKIGHGSVIGANTLVNKDIPPFSMVVGNPCRIIKRFDFDLMKWNEDDKISESCFFNEDTYLESISNKFKDLPIAYHSSSSQFGNI